MKTKNILFVIILFFSFLLNIVSAPILTAQSLQNNFVPKERKDIFKRVETVLSPNELQVNFYPISDGDFWEYITVDTTTLLGQFYSGLNFSITKEIVSDTVMTNGFTYKKIKWENIANSVNYPEWYDYHRIDTTGNVHLFYEGSDYLLFDFSLGIGQSYSSHLPNHIWKITDRYEVIAFGDTIEAIDFELLEQGTISKEEYSFVENFGMIYYQQNKEDYKMPEGNFWGAVINGEEYGTMIATKQTVDWIGFYPLHIGDYWVYEGQVGYIPTLNSVRIISDTLMADGNMYFKSLDIDHTFGYTSYSYKRIDSTGIVSIWDYLSNNSKILFEFSNTVGDTLGSNLAYSTFRHDSKLVNIITDSLEQGNFLYPDLGFISEYYDLGLGLYYMTADQSWSILRGANINGHNWGDTVITNIIGQFDQKLEKYLILPCYPNPFNSSSTLTYYLPISSTIEISLYNSIGEQVSAIFRGYLPAGNHKQLITAEGLSSGVYFVLLNTEDVQLITKIIYLK